MAMIHSKPCPSCHGVLALPCTEQQYQDRQQGALIQDVFPDLSTDDRERFISGYCPQCWTNLFGEAP